jgi:hypothetical protein
MERIARISFAAPDGQESQRYRRAVMSLKTTLNLTSLFLFCATGCLGFFTWVLQQTVESVQAEFRGLADYREVSNIRITKLEATTVAQQSEVLRRLERIEVKLDGRNGK